MPLPLREERGFSFDPEELERLLSERTRLVILNSPQNPTGGVIPQADLERAAAAIERTAAWVLTDEVYSRITYDVEAPSIASLPGMLERTILLDGFSKTFAMTGWRLGYAAVPAELVDPLTRLIVNSTSCVPPFAQLAGVAALEGPQDAVGRDGGRVPPPPRLPRCRRSTRSRACAASSPAVRSTRSRTSPRCRSAPAELADRLLDEAGVAVLAGTAFGRTGRPPAHLVRVLACEPRAGGRPHRRLPGSGGNGQRASVAVANAGGPWISQASTCRSWRGEPLTRTVARSGARMRGRRLSMVAVFMVASQEDG